MDVKVDLRVVELLASRLCHDLISPIGAVNNGLELLEDEDSGMAEDALELSIKSARRAAGVITGTTSCSMRSEVWGSPFTSLSPCGRTTIVRRPGTSRTSCAPTWTARFKRSISGMLIVTSPPAA